MREHGAVRRRGMEKQIGAAIERGEVLTAETGLYTVKSLDRDGIESLPIAAINSTVYQAGDRVYFFLFRDEADVPSSL